VIQPVLERRAHDAVDRRHELGVVETILRLPLELRLGDEDAEHAGQPFADVFRDQRHSLRRQIVGLDEIADRLADAGAQPALVRAAGSGRNAVDVRAQVLVGRFGPLQHDVEPHPLVSGERERHVVYRLRAALGDDLPQVIDEPFRVFENRFLLRLFVLERDLQPFVQVAGDLEPLPDHRRIEFDLREDSGVRVEVHHRAGAAGGAELLQRTRRLALLELHLPAEPVAPDGRHELLRQRVHDTRADAVKAARGFVAAVLEFASGVEHREDHFDRALLRRWMFIDWNTPAIVFDRD
jgi:hypothetical protein